MVGGGDTLTMEVNFNDNYVCFWKNDDILIAMDLAQDELLREMATRK